MAQVFFFRQRGVLRKDQGSALVIALVMLVVLTLMAVAGMQATSIQERMAGNMRDKNLAFQAAEAVLREAESYLNSATLPPFEGEKGLHQPDRTLWLSSTTWDPENELSWEYEFLIDNVVNLPRYIIEELPTVQLEGESEKFAELPDIGMFRTTARAVGGTGSAEVILQTVYRR